MPVKVYLGLGSNLNSPARQIKAALKAITKLQGTQLVKCAPWYQSIAIGPGSQGRKRIVRWGPRTLDIDILLYANQTLKTRQLEVPHPRISARNFVLYPLADIAPKIRLPDGTALARLLANSSPEGIVRLDAGGSGGRTG